MPLEEPALAPDPIRWDRKELLFLPTGKDKPSSGALIAFEDIEERKQAEQAREEIQEQWRAAFENSPTMCFIVDSEGTVISANTFGAEQLGYALGDLPGKPIWDTFYEYDREAVSGHFQWIERCCNARHQRVTRARNVRRQGAVRRREPQCEGLPSGARRDPSGDFANR
jgi:PAS domain S-box-containing protein